MIEKTVICFFFFGILLAVNYAAPVQPPPIVSTQYGQISGSTVSINLAPTNRTFRIDTFFAVPFARPPVGSLRFEKPVPPSNWTGILNTTTPPLGCAAAFRFPDWQTAFSEDCLYVNIFTPHAAASNPVGKKLPVLFLVVGGGYSTDATANYYYNVTDIGQKFISQHIITVSIQARVGFLGFATDGSACFPGNLGYWDMAAALEFVHANIAAFGGDPDRITVNGYSSGGSSTSALGLSPITRDLFSQAIQQSGSPFAEWTTDSRVINYTATLTGLLNCTGSDNELKNCMRNYTVDEIYDQIEVMSSAVYDLSFVKFGPWIDGSFFPHDYPTLITQAPKKPAIMGMEANDAILFTLYETSNNSLIDYYLPASVYYANSTFGAADIAHAVRTLFNPVDQLGANATANLQNAIIDFYTAPDNSTPYTGVDFYLERYARLFSDIQFIVPILYEANLKVQNGWDKLYIYQQLYVNPAILTLDNPLNPIIESPHGNVVFATFNPNYVPAANVTSNDTASTNFWVNTMVNFIKHGKPTLDNSWLPNTATLPSRGLQVNMPTPNMVNSMLSDRMGFWNGIFAQYPSYNVMRGLP